MSYLVRVVLMGPPASGKGTVALRIGQEWGYPVIQPGVVYSRIRESDTPLGAEVRAALADGGICPDAMTNRLMDDEVSRKVRHESQSVNEFIFDGYPRSLAQLEHLDTFYRTSIYLHLESDQETLLQAALNRRKCPHCESIFSTNAEAADRCSCAVAMGESGWIRRFDDSEEVFPGRISTYRKKTQPVIDAMIQRPNYIRYDLLNGGEGALDRLMERLRPYLAPTA